MHARYLDAFTAALSPVFLVAAVLVFVAFGLTWLLREIPLRKTAETQGVEKAIATPSDGDSFRELERQLLTLARRDERWEMYERVAADAHVDLEPPEAWLLARLAARRWPVEEAEFATDLGVEPERLHATLTMLTGEGLVTGDGGRPVELTVAGRDTYDRLVTAGRSRLAGLLEGWDPEGNPDVRRLLDEVAESYAAQMPSR